MTLFLEEKLHLHTGQLDNIMIVQQAGLRIERPPVYLRRGGALDVGDEVALRSTSDDGYLYTWLAQGGEVLYEVELLPRPRAAEDLDGPEQVRFGGTGARRSRCAAWRGCSGPWR